MYTVGIVGCGFIAVDAADSHAKAYIDNINTDLRYLIDIDRDKETEAYEKVGIPYINTHINHVKCDIVSICTPVDSGRYRQMVEMHTATGCRAILMEKPIAPDLHMADAIIKYCEHRNILLVVNHQRRFINPKFTFSRGILHTGTHAFDLIRNLFGEIVGITADSVYTNRNIVVEIDYRDTDERVFNLDCTRSTERMIPNVVEYIVDCLDSEIYHQEWAREARRDLEVCLKFQELYDRRNQVTN